jgi:hypothetical protein
MMKKRGLIHAFASNSNCSKRSRLSKEIFTNNITNIENNKICTSNKGKHRKTKYNKKMRKIGNLPEPINDFKYKSSKKNLIMSVLPLMISKQQLYVTGVHDPVLASLLLLYKKPHELVNIFDKFFISDSLIGSKMMESESVPIYILVPRYDVIQNSSSPHADVNSLKVLLNKYNNNKARGMNRSGVSTKYSTLGVHCSRNKPGLFNKHVHECCQNDYNHIYKMLCRVQQFAKMWLPYGLLSTLKKIKETVKFNESFSKKSSKVNDNLIWASIATSCNYISPSHVDNDAFLSCLTVSCVKKGTEYKKQKIDLNMPVAVFFCFPESNIAVALRPGDILFFNPLYHHCLSQRTKEYIDEEVYVTSFYLKSGQLSGNDNSIKFDNIKLV